MPVVYTCVPIDLRPAAGAVSAAVEGWAVKGEARAHLAALRAVGLNCDGVVSLHRARFHLSVSWVIGRPDPLSEFKWLMMADGRWLAGRLTDGTPCRHEPGGCRWDQHASVWVPRTDVDPFPATFTHVTETVPHSGSRRERYRTKSNGSCGRWVRTDDSVARCICGWRAYESTRAEARSAAAHHRAHPEEFEHHTHRPTPVLPARV